ncbi:hypothetical protein QYE76_059075 [Lolium multiflorum]|uniref:RNase H type-1 domain-containing protein n=1 Tax=Lolium multiflorum TaxID=4521 RepID=A0AAD8WQL4_LOLMU|nr:hypothetical protein QYE76_059075 [Lolium multiflorum]
MENYSLLMGVAAVMKMAVEMAAVSMEKPSGGTSPLRQRAQRFLSPRSWPRDGGGSGSHRVYFGTVPVRQRLSSVLVAPDPPRWLCAGRAAGSVEVMVTGAVGAGKEAVDEGAGRAASTRAAKPPLERDAGAAGASSAPPATPLQAAMNVLATPIAQNIDPAAAQAELEAQRQKLLANGADIVRAQRELNLTLREYNAAHGFASVSAHAARIPENRLKARNLDHDLRKEVLAGKSTSASVSIVEKPKYSSPDKTIKAAKAAVELCESLSGDALAKQQERVRELLETIEQQNAEQLAKLNKAAASKSARSTKNAGSKSHGQASSPHPDRRREKEMNAQQMTVYDPVLAGKQQAGQHDAGRKSQGAGRGYARGGYAGNNHAGRYETGQNYRAARAAYEEMPPPRYRQARAAEPERYGEGDSEVERTRVYRNPLGERLGERCLPDQDARHRLDRVHLSEMIESEGPPGPKCFGPRIMGEEPPVRNFQLPRDTKTYDGTTKPEDWLADYVTAVYVAGGGVNRRWAVRIIPSYLVGPARIWLNNLPAGSINGWLDFEEAFVNNFSSTYKRPNRPQQLALCQQRAGETDRDYLTRWNSTRNTCEGVIEAQAIAWFSQGCRRGSPLWQKLQRSMPATLAEMIRVADSYALGDPLQPAVQAEPEQSNPPQQRQEQYRDNRNNKRREDFPDRRELAEHSLNVRKDAKLVRQPLRRFAEDRRKIIGEEVTKLLVAGFIVEVTHTEWLANPVMVEKKKDENLEAKAPKVWRMCIDYTNLNKACPRDPFPLPRIDQVIDSTAGSTNRVVSVVVVVEREEEGKTVQRPVYYLSEVLSSSKQNYPHFQKMTYGVFMAATKLKHYFEEHPMKVVSEAPISDIMCNKDASGRIAKWAIQLSPYVPVYERRDAIKSQALADFLVDWAEMQYKPSDQRVEYWKMHFDGSKLKEGLGAGVVLTSPKGDHLRYVLQVHFRASNNVAEYEALIHGLKVAKEIGAHRIICYGDSDLVVQQCSGDWDAKDANMASYRFHVQKIAGFFEGCEFHHVPRAENEAADALSKLGSSRQEIPPGIALAHLRVPSIKPSPESESIFVPESHVAPMDIDEGNPGTAPVSSGTAVPIPEEAMLVDSMDVDVPVFLVREAPSWVKPIKEFLINGTLPVDENESRRIQRRSKAYTIINGEVYKRSVTGVLQR